MKTKTYWVPFNFAGFEYQMCILADSIEAARKRAESLGITAEPELRTPFAQWIKWWRTL